MEEKLLKSLFSVEIALLSVLPPRKTERAGLTRKFKESLGLSLKRAPGF